jgi:hypothetical protein
LRHCHIISLKNNFQKNYFFKSVPLFPPKTLYRAARFSERAQNK